MSSRFGWRIGISIHFSDSFEEELAKAKDAGFSSVDFDLCQFWTKRDKEIELYTRLEEGLEAIKRSGLYFNAVHISFGPNWDVSLLDSERRRAALTRIKEIFERCNPYSPYTYVIHGGYNTKDLNTRPERIENLKSSLRELRKLTECGIALENLPRNGIGNTSEELISIIDSVEGIGACIDTNHFLQEKVETAILSVGKRILTTHISDCDYLDEKHWMPGEGIVDFRAVISALEDVGYEGSWTYELGLMPTKTVERRRLEYSDFIRNADELFSGKPITVLGKPIKD